MFVNNIAYAGGGAIESSNNGQITFEGNSSTVFVNNTAYREYGGAINSKNDGQITFKGISSTVFVNNIVAQDGGAIQSYNNGQITFEGNSSTVFVNNTAVDGGAIKTSQYSCNIFEGNSTAEFNNNIATFNGGAIYCYTSNIYFEEFSTTTFRNNIADYGGAMSAEISSNITFSANSTVLLTKNKGTFGATTYSNGNSKIITNGNSTVIFDDISARWCNNTCLPYTGQSDTVTIDSNGIVWCSNQEAFICLSVYCYCKNIEDLFSDVKDHTVIDIEDKVIKLSSVINLRNISIIGHNNITVLCINGGRLTISGFGYADVAIEGITWIGCGGYSNIQTPVILLNDTYIKIFMKKCSFQHSLAPVIRNLVESIKDGAYAPVGASITIIQCSFINNYHYKDHGVAVYYSLDDITYDY